MAFCGGTARAAAFHLAWLGHAELSIGKVEVQFLLWAPEYAIGIGEYTAFWI